jgi:hypothetical protein
VRRAVLTGLAFLIALGAYCGAWWYVSEQTRAAITTWIAAPPEDRITISQDDMHRGGFPFAVRWTIEAPTAEARWVLGDLSIQARSLALWSEVWTPSKVRFHADKPRSSGHHAPTGRAWRMEMGSLSGSIERKGGGALDVDYAGADLVLTEITPNVGTVTGRTVAEAKVFRGAARRPERGATSEGLVSQAATLRLEDVKVPGSIGILDAETGHAQARFTLRGAIGDGSIEDLVAWRDQGGVLEIEKLDIDWTPLDLAFEGTLALDEQLRLLGAGTADMRGLPTVIDKLVYRGDIKSSEATITKLALALLTRVAKDGGAAVVRLPLTAQDGKLRAGPFTLGRLPPIVR